MRLRRFLISEPMAGANDSRHPRRPPSGAQRPSRRPGAVPRRRPRRRAALRSLPRRFACARSLVERADRPHRLGGPPAHIALLRRLCVQRRGWISRDRVRGRDRGVQRAAGPGLDAARDLLCVVGREPAGAIAGGIAFIAPGLVIDPGARRRVPRVDPPGSVLGAAAGAERAVRPSRDSRRRICIPRVGAAPRRVGAGSVRDRRWSSAAALGPWLVWPSSAAACRAQRAQLGSATARAAPWPLLAARRCRRRRHVRARMDGTQVGALSFGGGFVIIPLMQSDAVHRYHWLTNAQFLGAVALGQITPGRSCRPWRGRLRAAGLAAGCSHADRVLAVVHVRLGAPAFRRSAKRRECVVPRRRRARRGRRDRRRGRAAVVLAGLAVRRSGPVAAVRRGASRRCPAGVAGVVTTSAHAAVGRLAVRHRHESSGTAVQLPWTPTFGGGVTAARGPLES